MPKPLLRYDAANVLKVSQGRGGAVSTELKEIRSRTEAARTEILRQARQGEQGWLHLPTDTDGLKKITSLAKKMSRFKACLVIGIGGSDLGTRALYAALRQGLKTKPLYFVGSNTDPDELHEVLAQLDLRYTLVNIVSKSGGTIEPMATFFIVREALKRAVGKGYTKHIVATTDTEHGVLRGLVRAEGYEQLVIPANVGGRFSVLTAAGLFPLAWAGVSIKRILEGAAAQAASFKEIAPAKNDILQFSALHYLADVKWGQSIHVLMPYVERLRLFGFWYRQLWAESLGKRLNREGEIVHVGPTPIAALGATDQHSQLQLYMEGPKDKLFTFIETERFQKDFRIPREVGAYEPLAYAASQPLSRILKAERLATAKALADAGRPNGTLFMPSVSPESLGALIMFFQCAVAVVGELYGINTYDQPGVEAGKRNLVDFFHSRQTYD